MIRKSVAIPFEEQPEKENYRLGSKKPLLSFICLFGKYLLGDTLCQVLRQALWTKR